MRLVRIDSADTVFEIGIYTHQADVSHGLTVIYYKYSFRVIFFNKGFDIDFFKVCEVKK